MPGPFAPTISANVAYESPVAPVKPAPTFLEGALGIAEAGLKMYNQEQRAAGIGGSSRKPDPNLKLFSEELDKISEIRSTKGEMAARLAERNLASNIAAQGISMDTRYKDVYQFKTGRSPELFGRDEEAVFRNNLLNDEAVQDGITASYAVLGRNVDWEDRVNFAAEHKAKLEAAGLSIAEAQADATIQWTTGLEAKYNTILEGFVTGNLGRLVQREQSGNPITAIDIARLKVSWDETKITALRKPDQIPEEQVKVFNERVTQVDNLISTLEKASSNEVLRDTLLKNLSNALGKVQTMDEVSKNIFQLAAIKGDTQFFQNALPGTAIVSAMEALRGLEVPTIGTNIFSKAVLPENKPVPTEDSIITKEDLPPELLQKYGNLTPQQRVGQLKANGKYASLFTPSLMTSPENQEAFGQHAMSLATTVISGENSDFLSPQFIQENLANPNIINAVRGLELNNPELGMKVRRMLRSSLLTEKLRQDANLGAVDRRIEGAKFNDQTGKYEIDAVHYGNRPQDLAAFNSDLNEFYNGDLAVASRDEFRKIYAKYSGFRVSGANATNVVRLGNLNAIPEALKRRDAMRVIDKGVNQLSGGSEDMMAPLSDTVPRAQSPLPPRRPEDMTGGTAEEPTSEERSILQSIGEFFLGSPAAASELPPELRDLALSYARQGRPEDASGFSSVVEAGRGYTTVTKADGTTVRREGSRNWRNNNPGNIEAGAFANRQGSIGSDGRFAVFPTYEQGREAQRSLLFESGSYKNKTISEAINRYAPPSENDTGMYIKSITDALNVGSDTKMSSLSDEQQITMLDAMEKVEGFKEGSEQVISSGQEVPPLPPRRPEVTSDAQFISEISKALAETPTERRVREAQARQAAKEAYYRSLNQ